MRGFFGIRYFIYRQGRRRGALNMGRCIYQRHFKHVEKRNTKLEQRSTETESIGVNILQSRESVSACPLYGFVSNHFLDVLEWNGTFLLHKLNRQDNPLSSIL